MGKLFIPFQHGCGLTKTVYSSSAPRVPFSQWLRTFERQFGRLESTSLLNTYKVATSIFIMETVSMILIPTIGQYLFVVLPSSTTCLHQKDFSFCLYILGLGPSFYDLHPRSLTARPWKNDGWETILSFRVSVTFQGLPGYVKLRGGGKFLGEVILI